jgi:hypothetical protein
MRLPAAQGRFTLAGRRAPARLENAMAHRLSPRRSAVALALAGLLAATPPASAQFPAVWIGGSGSWLAKKPGDWAFVDFTSPWQFFPDNNGTKYFFVTIPNGSVALNVDVIPGDNGVPLNFLGVEVSTLALAQGAELTLQNQATLSIDGISQVGGLLHNDGLIRLTGTSALSLPFVMPITGGGEIVMASDNSFISGIVGVLTHSSSHTISGFGQITVATLFNQGQVMADTPGKALKFTGGHLDNSGLLRAGNRVAGDPGGELRINALVSMKNSGQAIAENGFLKIEGRTLDNSGLVEAQLLGTVVLQDLDVSNGGGLLRVRTGGAFFFNGSNIVRGGTLEAEPGSLLHVASGRTELRGGIALTGLLSAHGGTLNFHDAALAMPLGRIHLAAGTVATTSGSNNSFSGGHWTGSGRLHVTTHSSWDGLASPILLDGPTIELHKATHRVAGSLVNHGRIALLNDSGFNTELQLLLQAPTAFTGHGELVFAASGGGPIVVRAADASFKLTHGPQHRITGATGVNASLQADLVNQGLVDSAGAALQMWSARIDNTGTLRSSAGQLQFTRGGGSFIANAGGRIESIVSGSVLFGSPSNTLAGGTLAGAGEFRNAGHLWLDGTSLGPIQLEAGTTLTNQNATLTLAGRLVNDGTLAVLDATPWLSGQVRLQVHGTVDVDGSGRLLIAGGDENVVTPASGDALLRLGSAQTLTTAANGRATLQVDLVNQGRVEARGATAGLAAPVASIRNTGIVGAFEGASFHIGLGAADTLVDNRGGRLETGAGSVIGLSGSHPSNVGTTSILGGSIAGAGRVDAYRFAVLDSLAIEAGATVRTGSGSNLGLRGSIANDGLIEVNDGTPWLSGAARLWVGGDVALSGSGQVRFFGTEGLIDPGGAGARLTLSGGQALTTEAGALGTVKVDLVNHSLVEGRGAGAHLQAQVASIRNTGLLAAAQGGVLSIGIGHANTLVDNTGGRIDAGSASFVKLSTGHPLDHGVVTVRGGTLGGAGVIEAFRFVMLDGGGSEAVTLAGGATLRSYSGSSLGLAGSIVNDGIVEMHDNTGWLSGPARLWVSGEVALGGSGQLRFVGTEGVLDSGGAGSRLAIGTQQTVLTPANTGGTIKVDLANQGRVESRGSGASLLAQMGQIRNTGVLAALDGGAFSIGIGNAPTLIDNAGGRLEAGPGSTITLSTGHPLDSGVVTVRGGVLAGAGLFHTGRFVVLDAAGLAAGATVRTGTGSSLYLSGSLANDGTLELHDGTGWLSGNGQMLVSGRVDLGGSGRLLIGAGTENLVAPATADALLAIGAQQTLTTAAGSYGVVRSAVLNHGRVEARGAGATLDLKLTSLSNRNTLAAAGGADLRIGPGNASTLIDNRGGRIEAGAGSRVFLADAGHPANVGITTVEGGVLGGTGTFFMQRAVLSHGVRIAPGQSPGWLDFNGTLALDPLGALQIEIGGLTPGSGHDRVHVAGAALLGGALELSLWGGFVPAAGDVFTILSAASVGGSFSNVIAGEVSFAGGSFDVVISAVDVKLMNFEAAPVPEPGTLLLFIAGLALLASRRPRNQEP